MKPLPSRGALWGCVFAALGMTAPARAEDPAAPPRLAISPPRVTLKGPLSRQQLLVTTAQNEQSADATRRVQFRAEDPQVVDVDAVGVLTPKGDGQTTVIASLGGQETRIPVTVRGATEPPRVSFEQDIEPILTRFGCNAGACHGKARGQNGFQLSLLGFDPNFDYAAIAQEARGRRLFFPVPEESLILRKASARVAHGGGPRLDREGRAYDMVLRWIASGAPRTSAEAPKLKTISVEPTERIMAQGEEQQLLVTAHFSDGSTQDVTHLAAFQSSESVLVGVSADGLIKAGPIPGEAAITARYEGHFAGCDVTIPLPGDVTATIYTSLPRQNFIDGLVWQKLQKLGITPSEPAPDATFLRRAFLDVIGRLPTADETKAFLSDTSPDKRTQLVDRLLDRPEYADYWANKWMDLLRPNPYRVGIKAVLNLDAWIRQAFRENMPYDQFVREVVGARGSTFRDGAVTVFRDRREPEEAATMVSQLFLGIRLECAKCHHHPFEVWGQDDFYGFAAYFARIGHKGTGLSPPISGSEEILFTAKSGSVKHPLTNESLPPKPLFGQAGACDEADADPREVLAAWITSPGNTFFARVMANRVWTDLMGRGLVEPVDDLRATNPPSNGPLLDALAADFRDHKYDVKHLLKTIMTSYVYGLSSAPHERNAADLRNYSRHYRQRLRAEVLLDAICEITEVPEKFDAAPERSRAVAIWTHRTPSLFLDTFGRPDPNQDPPCERSEDTSVVQALHLMNSPALNAKITNDDGRIARLAKSDVPAGEIVDHLYLLTYCRFPTDDERAVALELFDAPGANRRRAAEDLLWALLNSAEFVFKD